MSPEWEKHSIRWGGARRPLAEGVLPIGPRTSTVDRTRATGWAMQCPRRALFIFQVVDVLPASKDAVLPGGRSTTSARPREPRSCPYSRAAKDASYSADAHDPETAGGPAVEPCVNRNRARLQRPTHCVGASALAGIRPKCTACGTLSDAQTRVGLQVLRVIACGSKTDELRVIRKQPARSGVGRAHRGHRRDPTRPAAGGNCRCK